MEYDRNWDSDSSILTLNLSNFDETISNHAFVVVKFYASSASDDFVLKFDEASRLLGSNQAQIVFAKVDTDIEQSLAARYRIISHPTIILFTDRGKEFQLYDGPQDAIGMADCLRRMYASTPPIDNIVITGFFPNFSGPEYNNFIQASKLMKLDYVFQIRKATHYHLPRVRINFPNGRVYHKILHKGPIDIVNLVKNATTPGEIDNAKAMLFIDKKRDDANLFATKYHEIAEKYRSLGISFMIGDLEASQDAFWAFQLHKAEEPLIVIRSSSGEVFSKGKLCSPEDIEAFLENYEGKKLSNPREKTGLVEEVNAQSFQQMIIESRKNVFLLVGPWCDWCKNCKKLEQALDDVYTHYKDVDNIFITKLFKNDNEIRQKGVVDDSLAADNWPTLYFKKASEDKLVEYLGARNKNDIIMFIENNKEMPLEHLVEINSLEDVRNLIGDYKIIIVGVFPSFSGQEYANFTKVANLLSDIEFRTINAKHLQDCPCAPVVWSFNSFENKEKPSETKDFNVDVLVNFVKTAISPLVTLYGEHSEGVVDNFFYFETTNAKVMLFINRSHADAPHLESKYHQFAKKYRGQGLNFMLADLKATKDVLKYLDLEERDGPLFVISKYGNGYVKYLKPEDDFEALVKEFPWQLTFPMLVSYLDNELSRKSGFKSKDLKVLLVINRRGKNVDSFISKYRKVAKKWKAANKCKEEGIQFMIDDYQDVSRRFWNTEFSEFIIVVMNSMREIFVKVWLDHDDDIEAWIKDCKGGNVAKYIKSHRRAVPLYFGGDLSFEDVLESGRDVLVVLYGEKWVNYKKFSSVLGDVSHFAKENDIGLVIEEIDWDTVHYSPFIREVLSPVLHHLKTLSDYDAPTLYFKKSGGGVEVYHGDIFDKDNIIDFITRP